MNFVYCLLTRTFDTVIPQMASSDELTEFIVHHISNSNIWNPLPGINIPLISNLMVKGVDMSFSLHILMLFLGCVVLLFTGVFLYKGRIEKAPHGVSNLLEVVVLFVRNEICIPHMGEKEGKWLTPLFLNFFFIILILNLMGLVPFFATATSNINITIALAAITLVVMIVGGFIKNGPLGFFKIFVPPGLPMVLLPVLFVIELAVKLLVAPLALCIRLFANMIAGHMVIFSLIGLIMLFGWVGLPSLIMALFIYFLELLVAFIQAYIFTMLSAMFVGSFLHPSH